MRLWIRAETRRLLNLRAQCGRSAQGAGPEGSISKVLSAKLNQDLAAFWMSLVGPEATLKPTGYPMDRRTGNAFGYDEVQHAFLRAQANSIAGGTSDIARKVLGERVLGLPGEPRVDKGVPWRELRR